MIGTGGNENDSGHGRNYDTTNDETEFLKLTPK